MAPQAASVNANVIIKLLIPRILTEPMPFLFVISDRNPDRQWSGVFTANSHRFLAVIVLKQQQFVEAHHQ